MVFKQSGHCISFRWVVSWTICMYWVSSLWTVKYRMHGTRVQGCSIIWSLGWFFRFTQSHSKNGMSVQIVLDGTLSSESVVPFVHCLLLLKMDPVCTYVWKWFVSNQRRWTGCQVPTRPAFFPAAILARVSVYSTSPLLSPYLHLLRLCTTLSTVRGSKVAIGLENCHCLRECQNLRTSTLLFSFCTAAAEFYQFLTSLWGPMTITSIRVELEYQGG